MAVELNEGDVIQVRLNFEDGQGSKCFNVLHYELATVTVDGGGLFPGEDFAAVANELAENVYDNLAPVWADAAVTDCRFTGVTVSNIYPLPRSASYTYTPDPILSGTVLGEAMPSQDTPTILKRTAFGARWGIGRLFFVGLSESQQEGGQLTGAAVNAIQDFANALAGNISFVETIYTFNFSPILFGRPVPPSTVPRITQVVSIDIADGIIKTQRRRRPGKGI